MSRKIRPQWETSELQRQRRAALLKDERELQSVALDLLAKITRVSLEIGKELPDPQARVRLAFQLQNHTCDLILWLTPEGH